MLELRDLELASPKFERQPLAGRPFIEEEKVFMDVTFRRNRNLLGELALIWSVFPVPWLTLILSCIDFNRFWLFTYVTCSLAVLVNESFLKPWFKQPRPHSSRSFGMPSGHSLCAGLLVCLTFRGWLAGLVLNVHWFWGLVLLVIYLPIPWARWYNQDHTALQCLVGFCLGLLVALFVFPLSTLI